MPKTEKLGGNTLHTEPVLQLRRKSKRYRSEMETLSPNIATHIPYGRQPGDPMKDLDVNLAFCGVFMNTTLRAAVHLGKDYDANSRFVKKLSLENSGTAFQGNKSWSVVPLA